MSTQHTTEHLRPTGPTARRCAAVVVAILGLALVLGPSPTLGATPAQAPAAAATALPDPGAAEAEFVARINQLRGSRGLPPLSVDAELTTQARQWAATMSSQGRIFHAGDLSVGIGANWQKLGENVGVGGEVGPLFDAFVASPTHYANLVDPAYTRVGVGVVNAGDRLYTAHRFMALAPAPPPTTAPPPTAPPTTAPPVTAPPTTTPPTAPPPTTTTTTEPPEPDKLGPLERIAELVGPSPDDDA